VIARTPQIKAEFHLLEPDWQRVEQLQLIRRKIIESLSPSALDLLMQRAEILVEGGIGNPRQPGGKQIAYATVMLTIDLRDCEGMIRERIDEVTAERVAELMKNSEEILIHIQNIAQPHLADYFELDSLAVQSMETDFQVRTDGCQILIDADLSLATFEEGGSNDQKHQ